RAWNSFWCAMVAPMVTPPARRPRACGSASWRQKTRENLPSCLQTPAGYGTICRRAKRGRLRVRRPSAFPKHVFGIVLGILFLGFAVPGAYARDVLLPADSVAADGEARFFLISIGTSQYGDDFWPDLKWSAQDARKVGKAFGAKTGKERVVHLFLDEKASRRRILRAMEQVRKEARPRDVVAFYLSGHGTLALNDDGDLEQVAVLHATDHRKPLKTGLS